MEGKKNGNGIGHKIEERAEGATLQPTSVAALWVKIGDLCPECRKAALVNKEGCTGSVRPECSACGLASVRM